MTNLALRQIMIKLAQTKIRTALQNDEVQRCLIRAKSDFQHTESGVPQQVTLKFKVQVGPQQAKAIRRRILKINDFRDSLLLAPFAKSGKMRHFALEQPLDLFLGAKSPTICVESTD